MNDLELASDGLVLVGHKYTPQTENCMSFEGCQNIKGHMMKLNTAGALQWT